MPAATGPQVPALPATLQASQEPPHAELQHTPSTQLPLLSFFQQNGFQPSQRLAFTRRLDAVVDFPLPGPEERRALMQIDGRIALEDLRGMLEGSGLEDAGGAGDNQTVH